MLDTGTENRVGLAGRNGVDAGAAPAAAVARTGRMIRSGVLAGQCVRATERGTVNAVARNWEERETRWVRECLSFEGKNTRPSFPFSPPPRPPKKKTMRAP